MLCWPPSQTLPRCPMNANVTLFLKKAIIYMAMQRSDRMGWLSECYIWLEIECDADEDDFKTCPGRSIIIFQTVDGKTVYALYGASRADDEENSDYTWRNNWYSGNSSTVRIVGICLKRLSFLGEYQLWVLISISTRKEYELFESFFHGLLYRHLFIVPML